MFYIIFLFSFFLFVLFSWTKDSKKKEKKKKRKLNHELNFLYGNLFGPIIFSSWLIKVMVSAIEASIGILKAMYKHYMDNNEDASFKDRHICIFNCKNKYQYFLKYLFDPE